MKGEPWLCGLDIQVGGMPNGESGRFSSSTVSTYADGNRAHALLSLIPTGALELVRLAINLELTRRQEIERVALNPLFRVTP